MHNLGGGEINLRDLHRKNLSASVKLVDIGIGKLVGIGIGKLVGIGIKKKFQKKNSKISNFFFTIGIGFGVGVGVGIGIGKKTKISKKKLKQIFSSRRRQNLSASGKKMNF